MAFFIDNRDIEKRETIIFCRTVATVVGRHPEGTAEGGQEPGQVNGHQPGEEQSR